MRSLLSMTFLIATLAGAQDAPKPTGDDGEEAPAVASGGVKTLSGMSVLGNEEAPKSLVIVPWKSSKLGDGIGVHNGLDDRPRPVDKEVFMRELRYYELRSGTTE